MKRNFRFWFYSLMVVGLILMTTASCDNSDDNDSPSGSTVKDIDGNVYHTVTIGTQVWMVENLKVTKYNDGTPITKITDNSWDELTTGGYCNYDNTESYATTYGRLYNWYAVETGKLAPKGWHVPSKEEWSTLIVFLGGNNIAGGKLKAKGSTWASPNEGATNEEGFSALPGGDRSGYGGFGSDGGHYSMGEYGVWWSSTGDGYGAWHYTMSYDNSRVSSSNSQYEVPYYGLDNNLNFGKSVRCIKD